MPVIYPSDRFDRAFFVFAKLRNHQIIIFFSFDKRWARNFCQTSPLPCVGQRTMWCDCDVVVVVVCWSLFYAARLFRHSFSTHINFLVGCFSGPTRGGGGAKSGLVRLHCSSLGAQQQMGRRRRRGNAKKKKRWKARGGRQQKKGVTMDFLPAQEGSAAAWGERAGKELDRKGGFSLSLSPVCVLVGCNMLSLIGFEKKRKRVELPFHIIWDSRRPYAGTDVRGGEKTSRMCVCVCRRGWKGCCCCCPAHPSRRAEISAAVEAATIDACL